MSEKDWRKERGRGLCNLCIGTELDLKQLASRSRVLPNRLTRRDVVWGREVGFARLTSW